MTPFPITIDKAESRISRAIEAGIVPFLRSSPGLGKSTLYRLVAEAYNLKFLDIRLSQYTPVDLLGIPDKYVVKDKKGKEQTYARFLNFDTFPVEGTPIPEGYSGWLVLFDEFNSASRMMEAAATKIILDREVGQMKLHAACAVGAAGNLDTDRAITNPQATSTASRLLHWFLEYNHAIYLKHYYATGFDSRITGFLEFDPEAGYDFDAKSDNVTFSCPRTLEMLNDYIDGVPSELIAVDECVAAIGEGAGVSFHTYLKCFANLPKLEEILDNPSTAKIPAEQGAKFAVASLVAGATTPKNVKKILQYIQRLPSEFQAMFMRSATSRHPDIRREPAFAKNLNSVMEDALNDHSALNTSATP